MALFKSSKKTSKTISEVPSKSKASSPKTKAGIANASVALPRDSAEAVTVKSRKKSTAVANIESTLHESVISQPAPSEPLKAMAAAAGSSGHPTTVADPAPHANGSHHFHTGVSREQISHLAYQYWVERGYTHGSAEDDWKRAEAELSKVY